MTKKEALEKCRDQWKWLAETGDDDKYLYFMTIPIDPDDTPLNDCYCCAYDDQFSSDCVYCPLINYAWAEDCTDDDSHYDSWLMATDTEGRKFWATAMYKSCENAIADIEDAQKKLEEKNEN